MPESTPIHLDCTLRDGGYYNGWDFPKDLIEDYLQAMSALGADYVELGFRSLDGVGFKGACAFTTERFINRLTIPDDLKLGVMVNASELHKYPDGVISSLEHLFIPKSASKLTLVRIACHPDRIVPILPGCQWLKDQGYEVGINIMQIANLAPAAITDIARTIAVCSAVDVLYFADSMGSMGPEQTTEIITALRAGWNRTLGIHAHDNMGRALANTLRAIEDGVTWVDSTVAGMGRGAGNAKTEYLAIELADSRRNKSNITPLLSTISKHFKPLYDRYGWGTNAYYYLAGKYGIHPTFIQEMLSDLRYGDEDVLSVIEHLRQVGGNKFSAEALERGRHFYRDEPAGTWAPESLLRGQEILILGSGPSISRYRSDLEDYIRTAKPVVIALNTQGGIDESLIDLRAASHPVRLLADCERYRTLPQPLVTPASMLPDSMRASLHDKQLLDFGLHVRNGRFEFNECWCVSPTSLVMFYILAIAAAGKARRILLAGFDGYMADDPRRIEVDRMINTYQETGGTPPLLTITPSRFRLPAGSVYALLDQSLEKLNESN